MQLAITADNGHNEQSHVLCHSDCNKIVFSCPLFMNVSACGQRHVDACAACTILLHSPVQTASVAEDGFYTRLQFQCPCRKLATGKLDHTYTPHVDSVVRGATSFHQMLRYVGIVNNMVRKMQCKARTVYGSSNDLVICSTHCSRSHIATTSSVQSVSKVSINQAWTHSGPHQTR